jgi:hypothetical protein
MSLFGALHIFGLAGELLSQLYPDSGGGMDPNGNR